MFIVRNSLLLESWPLIRVLTPPHSMTESPLSHLQAVERLCWAVVAKDVVIYSSTGWGSSPVLLAEAAQAWPFARSTNCRDGIG